MRPVAPPPTWLWQAVDAWRPLAAADANVAAAVAGFDRFRTQAHVGLTLDMALGLTPPIDMRAWHNRTRAERRAELVDRRDELIREYAASVGESARHAGGEIERLAGRFETDVWPRMRQGVREPDGRDEEILAELHRISETPGGPKWPLRARQLRDIVGDVFSKIGAEAARRAAAD